MDPFVTASNLNHHDEETKCVYMALQIWLQWADTASLALLEDKKKDKTSA
jgi:hypothetical protein